MQDSTLWWIGLVMIYLIVLAVRDFRAKNYVWAALSAIAVVGAAFLPMQSHSVTIDLPARTK